ncbi:Demethylmenaquinone methyltransferase [Pseudovibrio sp. Ad5]|uniref:methyltransferase domain-containing protein n=1 Tax=Pseudovibrio sp. Ad5 TaxID=989436 RepID=UPI0007AEDC8A|nr:methyltransferase domain-containing protein [Pseudovibrio sp. Ad5]KZK92789.1 Demethylmenaquinone methyltransferase [Pseudovibrio sp. Ad5]
MTDRVKKSEHLSNIAAFYSGKLADTKGRNTFQQALAPDYDAQEIPEHLLGSSFGCGNPLAFSQFKEGETVLDLGSGAGLDLILAAEKTGPSGKVIGIDVSEDMIALAKRNCEQHGLHNIELHQGVIEHLPFPVQSMDWVISNCVINLSTDKAAVFSEINRVLKPGGKLVISDMLAEDLPDWLHMHQDLLSACISGAVSEAAYLEYAGNSGLTALTVLDRMTYEDAVLKQLIKDELPVALDELAKQLGLSTDVMLDKAVTELSGKVKAIKLYGEKPALG